MSNSSTKLKILLFSLTDHIKNYDKASKQFEKLLSGENIEYKEKSKKILNKISKL